MNKLAQKLTEVSGYSEKTYNNLEIQYREEKALWNYMVQ